MADVRWPARLALTARLEQGTTRVHARHEGPLRLLKTLHPEGPGIAHAVLVHPPGGLVGGDRLDIEVRVEPNAHLLVTTPAATRFYRSVAGAATQSVRAHVAAGARLEWVPLETLAYAGCEARNELQITLEPEAAVLASEVLGLGLPAAQEPFVRGRLFHRLAIENLWLDQGCIDAQDQALLQGPCGLAGHRVLGTLLLAPSRPLPDPEALLTRSRELLSTLPRSGVSLLRTPRGSVLLARALGDETEPISQALQALRALWRDAVWGCQGAAPRLWAL